MLRRAVTLVELLVVVAIIGVLVALILPDFNARQEGTSATQTTYAAITARSYHPGGVNVAVMDGSVHFVPETISPAVWRAAGTRAGQEPMLVPYQ